MGLAASPAAAGPGLALGGIGKVTLALGGLATLTAVFAAVNPGGGQAGYPAGSGIPKVYWPMHTAAAAQYDVNPYLLASIHMQESRFSGQLSTPPQPAQGVDSGVNAYGCCAGPMQFNMSNTWEGHQDAFLPIAAARPASYPLDRRELPSCRNVPANRGCVYDDFDAIAAAAHKLSADGADTSLDSAGTHQAVCRYIGDCAEVDECVAGSPNQYCQVLPRAREWERLGAASATPVADAGPISGGARGIVERAVEIARPHGTFVVSDHRPGDYDSDHGHNDATQAARDIAVPGIDALTGPPSPRLDEAVVEIGAMFGRSYGPGETIIDTFEWKGYRIQVIWRTSLYGGHMGHIHIGALRRTAAGESTQA